ncbi:MAG: hypothetical protein H0T61_01410 [Actinobacteria bacterium]|nr:hypothetical protein [Actinomycetota bacterium]
MTKKPIEYWRVTTLPDGQLDWKRLNEIVPSPDDSVPASVTVRTASL